MKVISTQSVRFSLSLMLLLMISWGGRHEDKDKVRVGDGRTAERTRMVAEQIEGRGISDKAVLTAMRRVPRELFVPKTLQPHADLDSPLPIGYGQTISQPFIVADMTARLEIKPGDKVLEIGSGSGYQAAVLAEIGALVFTIEIVPELASFARQNLSEAGYGDVQIRTGDGYKGWPEEAPFDAILITAAPPEIPDALIEQLAPEGRLIAPVGPVGEIQNLVLVSRAADGRMKESYTQCGLFQ